MNFFMSGPGQAQVSHGEAGPWWGLCCLGAPSGSGRPHLMALATSRAPRHHLASKLGPRTLPVKCEGLHGRDQGMPEGQRHPGVVQLAEGQGNLLDVGLCRLPTCICHGPQAYLEYDLALRGFRSRFLTKEKSFSTAAISKEYGARNITGILMDL